MSGDDVLIGKDYHPAWEWWWGEYWCLTCREIITRLLQSLWKLPVQYIVELVMCRSWIDTQGRSQMLYIVQCNGVISHWAQIWGLRVLPTTPAKNKCKTNASMTFAHHAACYKCLSLCLDRSRCSWHKHLTNHGYLDYEKNLKIPNLSPMPG